MSRKSFYWLLAIAGFGLAFYVYVISFDSWSETELLDLGPVWVSPMMFGFYGLMAEWAIGLIERGKAENLAIATMIIARSTRLIGLLPFLFLRSRNSLNVAFAACAFWIAIYYVITKLLWHLF